MPDVGDRPRADDEIGLAGHDRRRQRRNVVGTVLIVRIRIDDHIGALRQCIINAGHERTGEAAVRVQLHDMVDAERTGDLDGRIARAVIDDEPLHGIEAIDLAGERGQRDRQGCFFIEARNLNDELAHDLAFERTPGAGARLQICPIEANRMKIALSQEKTNFLHRGGGNRR